ncbi:MAG: hypothetical protein HOP08_14615 [Cyclobacteriaceae bacterium]|nr:hypothetical protein [Cyclobacteriaceae bacterium]
MRIPRTVCLLVMLLWMTHCSNTMSPGTTAVNKNNPELQQQGKFLMYHDKLFSGLVTEFYETGEIRSQSRYEEGLLHGETLTWYLSGVKESSRLYSQGEKEGIHQGWWPNGNQRFEYQFAEGQYHGTFKEWYENGKPLHLFTYADGKEVSAIGWRDNGKTYINFMVRNGRKYGLTNARLCYSLINEKGIYQ